MIAQVVFFVLGLLSLVAGAEMLVRGASALARRFGVSPLVIGLTIVSFGTSAPELAVSVSGALAGHTDVALGNVLGSNIFNVLGVLGLSALVVPLAVHVQVIRQEVPIMIGASVLLLVLMLDGTIGRLDGALLSGLLVAYVVFLLVQARRGKALDDPTSNLPSPPAGWLAHPAVQTLSVLVGLGLLVLGSDWLVVAATTMARAFGVSDLVIGLTIVAVGTSLPEAATSVAAAIKGERDIAVGNAVGSNIFNILGCLGISALVSPAGLVVPPAALHFDAWVMLAVALACLPVFFTGREIARWEGALFLGYYVVYATYLAMAASDHDALEAFSRMMLGFVVPLTVVTLVVTFLRQGRRGGRA